MSICFVLCLIFPLQAFAGTVSLDLEAAVGMAFAGNPKVKMAESDVAAAEEALRQAHRARGVNVDLEHASTYYDYQNSERYGVAHAGSYTTRLVATYHFDMGNVAGMSIEKARCSYEGKKTSHIRTLQDMRLAVATAYHTILQKSDLMKVNDESAGRMRKHVENIRIRHESGSASRADLLQSEVELADSEQEFVRAAKDYDVAVKELSSLIGLPLETQLQASGRLEYRPFPHALEDCIEYALQRHPSITLADLEIGMAKADVAIARGDRRPTASISASQNLESDSDWPGLREDMFSVSLNIRYTLSDAGVSASRVAEMKNLLDGAQSNRDLQRDAVVLSVNADFAGIMEAGKRIGLSMTAVEKAREAYDIVVVRYREGVGTNMDVLDADDALTKAESNHTQALCDYNIFLARLENSMGGSFEDKNFKAGGKEDNGR